MESLQTCSANLASTKKRSVAAALYVAPLERFFTLYQNQLGNVYQQLAAYATSLL